MWVWKKKTDAKKIKESKYYKNKEKSKIIIKVCQKQIDRYRQVETKKKKKKVSTAKIKTIKWTIMEKEEQ